MVVLWLLIALLPLSFSAVSNTLYAAPDGTGDACSVEHPCSLLTARDQARSIAGDVTIYLRGGTYTLAEPLTLTNEDSGVIFAAYPDETPVISGGRQITGWALHDAAKNIFRADAGDLETRQLYVNGVRAVRARGLQNPPGWTKTSSGYTAPDETLSTWGNITDVEIVSFNEWKSFRCGVTTAFNRQIVMKQPCWNNALKHEGWPIGLPTWIENAYELLDEPREWYLDRKAGLLYYIPAADENLTSAVVIVPVLETLIRGMDVRSVEFRGLTFAYATWLRPNTGDGYAVLQAGWTMTGNWPTTQWPPLARTPGAVTFTNPVDLRFTNSWFIHLGGVGLNLDGSARQNTISGSHFEDISSSGIQLGQVDDFAEKNERRQVRGNLIINNTITRIGVEYFDAVGIFVGYAAATSIVHNDIYDIPYTGISVGWGWGTDSYAASNEIAFNHIHHLMQVLRDGGGIYTLSAQPGTIIQYNDIHDMTNPYGGLYLDEGSQHITVKNNVVRRVPWWLHIWTSSIRNNTVTENCTDTANKRNDGVNNQVNDNLEGVENWTDRCLWVIDQAGVEKIG